MSPGRRPRVLIATAGFGDGHNSAARNLAKALGSEAEVLVVDPCAEGSPRLNNLLRGGYRFVTNHLRGVWGWIYRAVEHRDFGKKPMPFTKAVERALWARIDAFDPDVLVSTYPLYPYFVATHVKAGGRPRPLVTVITDSLEINAAWRKAHSDFWFVTDEHTRRSLVERDMPADRIVETGFAVDPVFQSLQPPSADDPARPFRVLFFPTARKSNLQDFGATILAYKGWPVELTIVLGRNVRPLYKAARALKDRFPGRVRIRGWSRRIPELLASHHLVVGKAGGATVHEALAARCPMLIHYLVPGQEEGNLELLRRFEAGDLAETSDALAAALRDLLADQAGKWRRWKRNLVRHCRPQASAVAARFILDLAKRPSPTP
jgi:processive 1,2-diacylglycerol beta-glucosyltransferase